MAGASPALTAPLPLEAALALGFAMHRPLLSYASTLDSSILPSALLTALALWRFERAARSWLSRLVDAEVLAPSVPVRIMCVAMQLVGITALWLASDWAVTLTSTHLLPSVASISLQSLVGAAAAAATVVGFSAREGWVARALGLMTGGLVAASSSALGPS